MTTDSLHRVVWFGALAFIVVGEVAAALLFPDWGPLLIAAVVVAAVALAFTIDGVRTDRRKRRRMRRRMEDPMGERLPHSHSDVPILAFKYAELHYWDDQFSLRPIFHSGNGSLVRDMDATCFSGRRCPHPPMVSCACGFYALKSENDVEAGSSSAYVRLDVELSGDVIVCTDGYRAEHQRILRVHVLRCSVCGTVPAVGVMLCTTAQHQSVVPVCAQHRNGGIVTTQMMQRYVPLDKIAADLGDLPLSDGWWTP